MPSKNQNKKWLREGQKQAGLLVLIIASILACIIAILGVVTGVIHPIGQPGAKSGGPSSDSSAIASAELISDSSVDVSNPDDEDKAQRVYDETDDETQDDEYYSELSQNDFFLFNGHSAPYSFANDREFSIKTEDGGTLKVGKKGGSVHGKPTGLILNIRHKGGNSGHTYGVQVFVDGLVSDGSFFALSGPDNKIYRMDTFTGWLGGLTQNDDGETVPTSSLGTLLFWRTWDQCYTLKYVDENQFGLVLTRDEPDTVSIGDVLIRLYDYNTAEQVGVYRLGTTVNYDTNVYSFTSLTKASVVGEDSDEFYQILERKVEKSVSEHAIDMLLRGDFFVPLDGFGEYSADDVDVFTVERPMWCEIVDMNGDVKPAESLEFDGMLVAATIKRTNSSFGPITVYYDVTYDYDPKKTGEDCIQNLRGSFLGYDWVSEKSWKSFYICNGFASSAQRAENALSATLYQPQVSALDESKDSEPADQSYAELR